MEAAGPPSSSASSAPLKTGGSITVLESSGYSGAWSTLDGVTLKIFDAKPLPAKDPKGIGGKMGEIVAIDDAGLTVVCADGRFHVTRVQPADGKKVDAGTWAKSANVAVKTRLV